MLIPMKNGILVFVYHIHKTSITRSKHFSPKNYLKTFLNEIVCKNHLYVDNKFTHALRFLHSFIIMIIESLKKKDVLVSC
jgi:hypothetical protein